MSKAETNSFTGTRSEMRTLHPQKLWWIRLLKKKFRRQIYDGIATPTGNGEKLLTKIQAILILVLFYSLKCS
jgi:hypothetical protein